MLDIIIILGLLLLILVLIGVPLVVICFLIAERLEGIPWK